MSEATLVRDLTGNDATAFRAVRLRALKDHPQAYGAAYEDEKDIPLEQTIERLNQPTTERFILGAFLDGELVGTIAGNRESRRNSSHRAHIGAMYVAPEARSRGLGRLLLSEAIIRFRAMEGVEDIRLGVTVGNDAARSLYVSMGFETAYIERRFLKINGIYYDIEWMIFQIAKSN